MFTEAQAKEKFCPFARHSGGDGNEPASNQWGPVGNVSYMPCLASACMAWRWMEPHGTATRGFCGLAGKP